MPKFIDHHEISDVAPEMAAAIGERIKAGEADEHGVKGLNVFLGKDGTAFCLSEAPDAGSVVRRTRRTASRSTRPTSSRCRASSRALRYAVPLLTGTACWPARTDSRARFARGFSPTSART